MKIENNQDVETPSLLIEMKLYDCLTDIFYFRFLAAIEDIENSRNSF